MNMARLTEYDYQLCIEICDMVANNQNIMDVLESDSRYPSWPTFRRWKHNNEELRTLYVSSQQDKAIAIEKEIDDTLQLLKSGEIESSSANVIIQTLKWKMGKFYPKMFGEKLDITTDGQSINTPISPAELQAAKERFNDEL